MSVAAHSVPVSVRPASRLTPSLATAAVAAFRFASPGGVARLPLRACSAAGAVRGLAVTVRAAPDRPPLGTTPQRHQGPCGAGGAAEGIAGVGARLCPSTLVCVLVAVHLVVRPRSGISGCGFPSGSHCAASRCLAPPAPRAAGGKTARGFRQGLNEAASRAPRHCTAAGADGEAPPQVPAPH